MGMTDIVVNHLGLPDQFLQLFELVRHEMIIRPNELHDIPALLVSLAGELGFQEIQRSVEQFQLGAENPHD